MSFKLFIERLATAMDELEFKRHEDGFNFENLPAQTMDRSYHIEPGPIVSAGRGSRDFDYRFTTVVRVFFAPQRNVIELIDQSLDALDDILNKVLDPTLRLDTDIQDIIPGSITPRALSFSNDNGVVLDIQLIGRIYKCY